MGLYNFGVMENRMETTTLMGYIGCRVWAGFSRFIV